ncbi:MAG: hypothetical protein PHI40_08165 [Caldisericia bacterium]|nr:hypothetical protein [Caldisericia bacterium]MDD4615358.1 hypothetical protein [Caldisericia bacterium]
MKQLLGNTIWIILLSIVVIVFVVIYGLERSHMYSSVDSIPFLAYTEENGTKSYKVHEWNVANGIVIFGNDPICTVPSTQDNFIWNGDTDFIFVNTPPEADSSIHMETSANTTFIRQKSLLAIQRVLRPDLHIQLSITDNGNHTQATAEYFGYKRDKYSLRPDLGEYSNAVLIRPLDAIEIEATTYVYFQFAWLDNSTTLKFGVIEGKLTSNLLDWRVITDDIGFQETGKGSNVVVCQGKLWFSLLDGSIYSVSVKKGTLERKEKLEEAFALGSENNTQSELYRFQNALIIRHSLPESPISTILVIENDRISNRIEVDQDFVSIFHAEKKSMYYQFEAGMKDSQQWTFPIS